MASQKSTIGLGGIFVLNFSDRRFVAVGGMTQIRVRIFRESNSSAASGQSANAVIQQIASGKMISRTIVLAQTIVGKVVAKRSSPPPLSCDEGERVWTELAEANYPISGYGDCPMRWHTRW